MLAAEAARHSCLRSFVSTATSSENEMFLGMEEDMKSMKKTQEEARHEDMSTECPRQQLCFGKWTWEAVVAARLETMPPAEAFKITSARTGFGKQKNVVDGIL